MGGGHPKAGLNNCERTGRAFDELTPYLGSFLRREFGDGPDIQRLARADFLALLKALLDHWNGRLSGSLPSQAKHYAHLLRDVRNRCAHGGRLSDREARHALDTVALLAQLIQVPPAVTAAIDQHLTLIGSLPSQPPPPEPPGAPAHARPPRPRSSRDAVTVQPVYDGDVIVNAEQLTADQVAMKRVRCPACGRHDFAEWPAGWDAHAAHRCTGLSAKTPEERKAEYRQRFWYLFRDEGRAARLGTQRAVMRRIHGIYCPDHERVVRQYATAEEGGGVGRASNTYDLTSEEYARRLLADGLKKGWLQCSAVPPDS